ncbi:MAG: 4Fe-4S cluster-binding domain-containing protein, partial [Oscillospiraceae bacterium]|nr:4Fe-4S cluster-binding domain-containing protein [Oscillospiraceae bacterium]
AAGHYWEEPVISGEYGSGAVFFSGCTLRCKFCQNYEISTQKHGFGLNAARMREIFEELIAEGHHNINLVTPTHFLPDLLPALEPKLPVPVVYNCGGYERVETLRALEGRVDVWLPDMKYSDPGLARVLSAAPDYAEVAKAAISEMYRQTGPCVIEDGLLRRGVLIRHLILPGQVDNSIGVLEWIAKTFPKGAVLVSLMSQYVPMGPAAKVPPFDRRITREEYDTVLSWMYLLGLDAGFLQGPEAASLEYVPEFDGTGILKRSKAPNED